MNFVVSGQSLIKPRRLSFFFFSPRLSSTKKKKQKRPPTREIKFIKTSAHPRDLLNLLLVDPSDPIQSTEREREDCRPWKDFSSHCLEINCLVSSKLRPPFVYPSRRKPGNTMGRVNSRGLRISAKPKKGIVGNSLPSRHFFPTFLARIFRSIGRCLSNLSHNYIPEFSLG